MNLHHAKFPDVWKSSNTAVKEAALYMEAKDMSGRPRSFTKPEWDVATLKAMKR